jgi:ribosomal protein L27
MGRRIEPRFDVDLPVKVWGQDLNGKPFVQYARTINANAIGGARLAGIDCVRTGEIIAIQHGAHKSNCRVIWVGQDHTPRKKQIGIHCFGPDKLLLVAQNNLPEPAMPSVLRRGWEAATRPLRKPMPEMPASRRKSTRYYCTGGVELRGHEGAAPVFANLSDVSLEGCYVEAVSTLAAGSEVLFLMRVRDAQIRGRAMIKTSNHAVGMGLEFLHLAAEDQHRLEFLVGTLAGTQEMLPEEKRVVVAEDPIIHTPIPRPTRPTPVASMNPPPRPAPQQGNSAMAQKIMRAIGDLNELEQNLVKDRIDPRLIAQLHDAVEHLRQTAWTVQQWMDLNSGGGDPFDVLPQLEAERMHMLGKLAHNVTADIDSTGINRYTLGISDLYETIQQLYRRLRKMLVEDAPQS